MVLLPGSDWFARSTQKQPRWGQCLFSFYGSLPPSRLVLAQVWTYQRQSSSVMWPNHFDTHLACSSADCYEYSSWSQGPVRGSIDETRIMGAVRSREGKQWHKAELLIYGTFVAECIKTQIL